MSNDTTAIQDIINRRVETGLADLLLMLYDAGYCAALGRAIEPPADGMADIILLVEARHHAEVLALRGWCEEPRVLRDNLPAWLLSLPNQSDNPQMHAAAERVIALGEGWGADGWPI